MDGVHIWCGDCGKWVRNAKQCKHERFQQFFRLTAKRLAGGVE